MINWELYPVSKLSKEIVSCSLSILIGRFVVVCFNQRTKAPEITLISVINHGFENFMVKFTGNIIGIPK